MNGRQNKGSSSYWQEIDGQNKAEHPSMTTMAMITDTDDDDGDGPIYHSKLAAERWEQETLTPPSIPKCLTAYKLRLDTGPGPLKHYRHRRFVIVIIAIIIPLSTSGE